MNAQSVKDAKMRQYEELRMDVERLKQRDDDWCQILWEQNKRIELLEGFIRLFKSASLLPGKPIVSAQEKPSVQ